MNKQNNKYDYVSFSKLNFSHTIDDLINAAECWRSMDCETIEYFDYASFRKSLLIADPLPKELEKIAASTTTALDILHIISHDRYRAGERSYIEEAKPAFLSKIEAAIKERRSVDIMIPSFPGREVNPLARTRPQIHLGELASLCRLAEIASLVGEIYEPGLRFIIVGDGIAYAPFYGDPVDAAVQYKKCLQAAISQLGLSRFIILEDLADIIAERKSEFDKLYSDVEKEITTAWSAEDYEFRDELSYTMRMGTQSAALNAAVVQLMKFPEGERGDNQTLSRIRAAIRKSSEKTAFVYQCLLVTLRRMELLDKRFPHAIRGTVHAKTGQYSPHLVNQYTTISPWHGVAVMRTEGRVDIVYEAEVLANANKFKAVYLSGEVTPFYYAEK